MNANKGVSNSKTLICILWLSRFRSHFSVFGFVELDLKTGMSFANQIGSMEKTLESMRYLLNLFFGFVS